MRRPIRERCPFAGRSFAAVHERGRAVKSVTARSAVNGHPTQNWKGCPGNCLREQSEYVFAVLTHDAGAKSLCQGFSARLGVIMGRDGFVPGHHGFR